MNTNESGLSGSSNICGNIKIYFILLGKSAPTDECNVLLNRAFQALSDNELSPEWENEQFCSTIKRRDKDAVFIFPVFEGKTFDYLRSLRCTIVGPALVLYCLQENKGIPKTSHPMISYCMEGVVVCCSNIKQAERDKIKDRIVSMGGDVEGSLSNACAILITTEVGSKKYKAAAKIKTIAIMTPDWVEAVWQKSHVEIFKVKDDVELMTKYKLPIFTGLTITVSDIKDRANAEKLIKENGGKFMGEMKMAETTHLVTDSTKSNKYTTAKKWKTWPIHLVGTAWLYESVNSGYCLDEEDYLTEKSAGRTSPKPSQRASRRQQKCSTPTNSSTTSAAPPFADANGTGMSIIIQEAPNTTVMSNVSLATTTTNCVNNTELAPITVPPTTVVKNKRSSDYATGQDEATFKEPNAVAAATTITNKTIQISGVNNGLSKNNGESSNASTDDFVSPAPLKRIRLSNGKSQTTVDVLNQYLVDDAQISEAAPTKIQDSNCSFMPPAFDLAEAYEFVDKAPTSKKSTSSNESPAIEQRLLAATKATDVGSACFNSPGPEDIKRSLAKHLQNVLGGRTSFRRNRSSNMVTPPNGGGDVDVPPPASPSVSTSSGTTNNGERRTLVPSQSSQSIPDVIVDWDDPNQKTERQKVGGLLRKRTDPTQNYLDGEDKDDQDPIRTAASEPEVLRENEPKKYFFQLTSLNNVDRDRYFAIIERLGGTVLDTASYDVKCTHLITASPTRNEKLLTAIACGLWVLHTSYLDASDTAGQFVDESDHEFGSRSTMKVIDKLRDEVGNLMKGCPRWRQKIQAAGGPKAFTGWNVFLCGNKTSEDSLLRILVNGGATATKNLNEAKEGVVTHVIIDTSTQRKPNPNLTAVVARLQSAGAICYKTDVIFAYLSNENLNEYKFKD